MPRFPTRHPNHLAWLSTALVTALLVSACAGGGTQGGGGGAPDASQDPAAALERACPETPSASAVASPQASASGEESQGRDPACVDGSEEDAVSGNEHSGTDGRDNIIKAINRKDDNLLVRGSVLLNQITGDTVRPSNEAWAVGYRCSGCQTFAVALQINLIGRNANDVQAQNYAVAANFECTNCITVARALQYTYTVDDPTETPREVDELIREMEHELRKIDNERGITLREAESRVNAVIARFRELAESLDDKRDEAVDGDVPTSAPSAPAGESPAVQPSDGTNATTEPGATEPPAATDAATPTAETSPSPAP